MSEGGAHHRTRGRSQHVEAMGSVTGSDTETGQLTTHGLKSDHTG